MGLNEGCREEAYVLGRLFAMLEAIQMDANPGIKATIRDRYFNSACATPAIVFPILFKLKNSHIKKLERDNPSAKIYYEKQIMEIMGKLGEKMSNRLTLEDQGQFDLGNPDNAAGERFSATSDETVSPIGTTNDKVGKHSPRNLWSTTITDQLRLATNFQAKVVGVSLKDRASILPAGHNPTGAFWYDDGTGNFVTSSYYMNDLPNWVKKFNDEKLAEKLVANGWNTLLPIAQYTESSPDNSAWEGLLGSAKTPTFPYLNLASDFDKKKGEIKYTPFGNTLTLKLAEASVDGEQLGQDAITDFLAINLASTDYAGHKYGPNSIEVEDVYLRLDKDLTAFFNYLDAKVGKNQYTVFLSADHGGAHSVGFLEEHKIPTGFFEENMKKQLNGVLKEKLGVENLINSSQNYQVFFDRKVLAENQLELASVKKLAIQELEYQFLQPVILTAMVILI